MVSLNDNKTNLMHQCSKLQHNIEQTWHDK